MQALEEALQETTRMSDLVDSLLTLARADEGRFDLHREPVALGPLVRDVYETAVILGEDAGLTVTMTVSRKPWCTATRGGCASSSSTSSPTRSSTRRAAARWSCR